MIKKTLLENPEDKSLKMIQKIKSNTSISPFKNKHNFLQRKSPKKLKNNFTEKQLYLQKYGSLKQLTDGKTASDRKSFVNYKEIETSTTINSKSEINMTKSRDRTSEKYKKTLFETTSSSSSQTWNFSKKSAPNFFKQKKTNSFFANKKFQLQNFKIITKLGSGKFGKVFMVKENQTGFIMALKVVQKKLILQQGLEQFIRQIKIQSFLSHPNIIEIYGFFHDAKYFYMMMELGCDGHLYHFVEKKQKLSEEGTSFITRSLLNATKYIHSHNIIHRDLKPQNIVMTAGNVKICDFGWAVRKQNNSLRSTLCGTPLYLCPQMIKNDGYDEKADLWAIGVLAYELHVGCSPFGIRNKHQLYKIVTDSINFPDNFQCSKQFIEFINAILNKNPQNRKTSQKLLCFQFIRAYSQLQTCEELCR